MKKASDVVSKYTTEFVLNIEDEEFKLSLGRVDLNFMVTLEEDYNVELEALEKLMAKKPAKWATLIAWLLLIEKEVFDNSIELFRRCLTMESIKTLTEAIQKVFKNSMPKNVKAEATKKK